MEQYIKKSALVAEIDRLENKLYYEPENFKDVGAKMALDSLKSFLDTLEVKGVDIKKEIDRELETRWRGEYLSTSKFRESAKHFFELGMQVSNKARKGE